MADEVGPGFENLNNPLPETVISAPATPTVPANTTDSVAQDVIEPKPFSSEPRDVLAFQTAQGLLNDPSFKDRNPTILEIKNAYNQHITNYLTPLKKDADFSSLSKLLTQTTMILSQLSSGQVKPVELDVTIDSLPHDLQDTVREALKKKKEPEAAPSISELTVETEEEFSSVDPAEIEAHTNAQITELMGKNFAKVNVSAATFNKLHNDWNSETVSIHFDKQTLAHLYTQLTTKGSRLINPQGLTIEKFRSIQDKLSSLLNNPFIT